MMRTLNHDGVFGRHTAEALLNTRAKFGEPFVTEMKFRPLICPQCFGKITIDGSIGECAYCGGRFYIPF